jgi:hypothetical protein
MAIEHVNATDPNIHEPKGASTAAINTVYVSDGAASGAWSKIPTQGLDGIAANGSDGQVVIVDGAGSHELGWVVAHGGCYFLNIGTPNTVTFPSVYTKVNPTTTAYGSPVEVTEGTNARITYTGTRSRGAVVSGELCVSQAAGATRDIRLAIYKNGSLITPSEVIITTTSAEKAQLVVFSNTTVATNDYFELYIRNDGASGDVSVYTMKLNLRGFVS